MKLGIKLFKSLSVSLLFIFSYTLHGQHLVSGKVVDSTGAVPYANVSYWATGKKFKEGVVTDETGNFKFRVREGNYQIAINFMGYTESTRTIKVHSKTDLGEIHIRPKNNKLSEVFLVSRAEAIERKNDRLVFNVANTTAAESGTALDVLSYTPSVIFNEGQLSILGKSEVGVLINGRISPLRGDALTNYLNSIPSNNIKRIEVITTPPSKYSAEGNGGLLNIILKRQKTDYWRVISRISGTQRHQGSGGANVTFNYKKDQLSLYANISGGNFKKRNLYRNSIYFSDETWRGDGFGKYNNKYLNGNFALDYAITSKWLFGVKYSTQWSQNDENSRNVDEIFEPDSNILKYRIESFGRADKDSDRYTYSIFNEIKLDTLGKKITASIDYFDTDSDKQANHRGDRYDENGEKVTEDHFANKTSIDYKFSNFSGRIDTELPFKDFSFELGTRVSLSQTKNDFEFFDSSSGQEIYDPGQSNFFQYDEDILAFYVSGNTKLSDHLLLKAGVRLEQTWTESYSASLEQTNSNDYLKLFPTFYSTYRFGSKKSFTFSFSRRLNRPYFESLDPFKIVLNPYKTIQGNPFLKPSFSWNYELIFNSGNNELKGYFQKTQGDYDQIGKIDPVTKVTNYTYHNYLDQEKYGITETYIFDNLNWLTSYNTVDFGYSRMQSTIEGPIDQQSGFNGFVQTRNQISFSDDSPFLAGVNFYYVIPAKRGLTESNGFGALDLTLRWKIIPKKLSLYLYANDVLNTNQHLVKTRFNEVESSYKNYFDTQSFRFSLVFGFGNNKVRVKSRSESNEDIQKRIQ